ncbi:Sugar (and other) transporter family protein [Aspergillus niger]|uniref:Sugar (And other) transporter family protein n=1 Tax=Aspergillus niger TaxID=5061 RepID=A0A505HY79_ASPNG|nr:Sugar (and other) transporter family protein [Aspergillus niger]
MTIPEFVASLHEMNLARYVTDQEGDTFKFDGAKPAQEMFCLPLHFQN